jgi:hypothetical protein
MNSSDAVQYEGVVFSDGTCVLRWRTAVGSCSVFKSFEDAMRIHGHPEYGTKIVFADEPLPLPWDEEDQEIPEEILQLKKGLENLMGGRIRVHTLNLSELSDDEAYNELKGLIS